LSLTFYTVNNSFYWIAVCDGLVVGSQNSLHTASRVFESCSNPVSALPLAPGLYCPERQADVGGAV